MDYIIYQSENVLLTHVIKCKIDVHAYQDSHKEELCKVCQEKAHYYCENDDEYFCDVHDLQLHSDEQQHPDEDNVTKTM